METYLVFVDAIGNSNKFWSGKVEGNSLTVQWGRVGYQAQTKVHECSSRSAAVRKFYDLVAQKKGKGYSESQSRMNGSCDVYEIERAIQLLNALRSYVVNRNFDEHYIQILNQYLKIVPTPLGMQIDPYRVYHTVAAHLELLRGSVDLIFLHTRRRNNYPHQSSQQVLAHQ